MLTLNLNLLYTVVNILVLFLLLRKFLYKPVMNIIAQRQKQVDDALNAAETSKQEAAAALNDAQAKLRNVCVVTHHPDTGGILETGAANGRLSEVHRNAASRGASRL